MGVDSLQRRAPGKSQYNIVQSCDTSYLFEKVAPAQNAFRMMGGKWLALRDGTAEINSTLARSLELLVWKAEVCREAMRARRNNRRASPPSTSPNTTRPSPSRDRAALQLDLLEAHCHPVPLWFRARRKLTKTLLSSCQSAPSSTASLTPRYASISPNAPR